MQNGEAKSTETLIKQKHHLDAQWSTANWSSILFGWKAPLSYTITKSNISMNLNTLIKAFWEVFVITQKIVE